MLDWLFLIFCSVRFLYRSFSLSLYMLGTLSAETQKGQKKRKDGRRRKTEEEEGQGEELYKVDIEVSWWIADLRTGQLNAF